MNIVEAWLIKHTFQCALGRISPRTCELMRARPRIGTRYRSGPYMPLVCENCKDWRNKTVEEIIEEDVKTKKCSKCGEIKALTDFYAHKDYADGYTSYCKACEREYRRNLKSRKIEEKAVQVVNAPDTQAACPSSDVQVAAVVAQPCQPYSTNSAFDALLRRMGEIHDAKRRDYASNDNPLGNFDAARLLGIDPTLGILIRMTDKFTRACNLAKNGRAEVQDESITDTLLDLANYSLLAILSIGGKK